MLVDSSIGFTCNRKFGRDKGRLEIGERISNVMSCEVLALKDKKAEKERSVVLRRTEG